MTPTTMPERARAAAAEAPSEAVGQGGGGGSSPPALAGAMLWPALAAPWVQAWAAPAHHVVCVAGPHALHYASGWIRRRRETTQAGLDLATRLGRNGVRHPMDSLTALTEASLHGANVALREWHAAADLWMACTGGVMAAATGRKSALEGHPDPAERPAASDAGTTPETGRGDRASLARRLAGSGHAFPV